jgi:hypothetical protein
VSKISEFPIQEHSYLTVENNGETEIRGVKCISGLLIFTDDFGKIQIESTKPLMRITKKELISFILTTKWWPELHELTKKNND